MDSETHGSINIRLKRSIRLADEGRIGRPVKPPGMQKSLIDRVCSHRACVPEAALGVLAGEFLSPSQRFWSGVFAPWCAELREHHREVVKDLARCKDFNEMRNSILYWRQRSPDAGFLGRQFRVHTSQALRVFERYDREVAS